MKSIKDNLSLFWQGALLSYIALFAWLKPVTYLASKIIMPLAQILFFTFLGTYASGKEAAPYYVIGNAMQITASSGIFGVTMSIGGERWSGTLPYLFGTPANRLMLFLGRSFMHIIDGILGVIIGLTWGALLLGVDYSHTDLWALLLTILVTTFSTAGLGLWMGCISLITSNVMFVNNTVYFATVNIYRCKCTRRIVANLDEGSCLCAPVNQRNCRSTVVDRRGIIILCQFVVMGRAWDRNCLCVSWLCAFQNL